MLNQNATKILINRGLDEELLAKWGIKSKLRNGGEWIAIPYVFNGKVVNHKYRTIEGDKLMGQDPDAHKCFWNFDILRDKTLSGEPIILTEGEFDEVALADMPAAEQALYDTLTQSESND